MAKFIDFNSIAKTDWTKPSVQKNPLWIVATVGALVALVSAFTEWITLKTTVVINHPLAGVQESVTNLSTSGLDNTECFIIIVGIVLALYGLLYRQWGVATVAGLVILVAGAFYMYSAISESATMVSDGKTFTLAELSNNLKDVVAELKESGIYKSHLTEVGGYGFLYAVVGGLLTTVCSFLLYKKSK